MSIVAMPRPARPDQTHIWTAAQLSQRLDEGDRARERITAENWPEERKRRREKLARVLVPDWPTPYPQVTFTGTIERASHGTSWTIHKLRFQSLPDYWVTALLYVPRGAARGR